MNTLSIDAIRPLNRWDRSSIRPGPVGSIGDVNLQVRYKQSYPDAALRWDSSFSERNEPGHGNNVTDGQYQSYNSYGGPSAVIDSNWGGRRDFKISHGWYYQDMRVPDRNIEPVLGELPQYTWHNKIARVYDAEISGDKFLPLPGGYHISPGEITRGGSFPTVTDVAGGTDDIGDVQGNERLIDPNFITSQSTGAPVLGRGRTAAPTQNQQIKRVPMPRFRK